MSPFKSEAQRRYLWKFHPKVARKWVHEKRGLAAADSVTRYRVASKGGRSRRR